MSKRSFFLLLGWLLLGSSLLAQQKRLALVIGNANYQFLQTLKNPENDANDISDMLANIGFDVITHTNLKQEEMKAAIKEFGKQIKAYDMVLFFYAGHGIEVHGTNFLIPVDAYAATASDIKKHCVPAGSVTSYLKYSNSSANIIILDACRSNPFPMIEGETLRDGLALMDAPKGTIISFATSPGRVASDGSGENGVFTEALLNYLNNYDIEIKDMFEKVRAYVIDKSNNKQVPWETTSLTEEIVLRRKPEVPLQVSILEGDSITFDGKGNLHAKSNLSDVSFHWFLNGKQFSTSMSPEVNRTGTYRVKAISFQGQILLSAPIHVRVKSFVEPMPYILEGNNVVFESGGTLHAKTNVRGRLIWNKEANYIGEGEEIQVDIPGMYHLILETSDGRKVTSSSTRVSIKGK